jgi:hypothetical protein
MSSSKARIGIPRRSSGWKRAGRPRFNGETQSSKAAFSQRIFMEIRSDGKIHQLSDELAMVAKHKEKPVADTAAAPPPTVYLHGDVAVAYGVSSGKAAGGKPLGFTLQTTTSGRTAPGGRTSLSKPNSLSRYLPKAGSLGCSTWNILTAYALTLSAVRMHRLPAFGIAIDVAMLNCGSGGSC